MEKKSIILDLFNEGVSYMEILHPKNEEYYRKVHLAEKKRKHLEKLLTEVQLEAVEDFLEAENSHGSIYNEETFRLGVSVGVRLTAEAFLLGE